MSIMTTPHQRLSRPPAAGHRVTRAMALLVPVALVLGLAACGPTEPSEADKIRALPAMSMDRSLALFRSYCVNGRPDASNGTVLLERTASADGTRLCTMRARAPDGVDEFAELRRRYGNGKVAGILIEFPGYSGGPLLFVGGVRGGAGEGTFQVAIRI